VFLNDACVDTGAVFGQVITVNGEFAKSIEGLNVNDRLIVKVVNRLNEPLSIHWHGITQVSHHGWQEACSSCEGCTYVTSEMQQRHQESGDVSAPLT
jgi:hypothetical protein